MAKSRGAKSELLTQYNEILAKGGFIAVDAKGLDNVTVTQLKKQLRAQGAQLTVVKNTIFKLALEESKYPVDASAFDGQTAVMTYDADPTVVAKMLKKVQKDTELMQARFGVVDGQYLTSERVMQLADIPSREVLLARLLGSMNSPLTGFMTVVTGNVRGLVRALSELSAKKA